MNFFLCKLCESSASCKNLYCINFYCTIILHYNVQNVKKHEVKALCHNVRHNCFLMSSLVQKFNQHGYRKYRYAQYRGIVHRNWMRAVTDFVNDQVEKLTIFSYGQPKDKNTGKGYTLLKMSNALHTESLGECRCEAVHHTQFSFAMWVHMESGCS